MWLTINCTSLPTHHNNRIPYAVNISVSCSWWWEKYCPKHVELILYINKSLLHLAFIYITLRNSSSLSYDQTCICTKCLMGSYICPANKRFRCWNNTTDFHTGFLLSALCECSFNTHEGGEGGATVLNCQHVHIWIFKLVTFALQIQRASSRIPVYSWQFHRCPPDPLLLSSPCCNPMNMHGIQYC